VPLKREDVETLYIHTDYKGQDTLLFNIYVEFYAVNYLNVKSKYTPVTGHGGP
jgi:hypothetical protein